MFWATKIQLALEKNKEWARSEIPVSWCRFEAEGTSWIDSFEEILEI